MPLNSDARKAKETGQKRTAKHSRARIAQKLYARGKKCSDTRMYAMRIRVASACYGVREVQLIDKGD
jgi:hypothetical protein